MKNYFSFVSLLILFSCSQSADKDSLRSLSAGLVIGFEGENNTFVWKGIPFASPPIDSLRWKAPLDPEPWEGTLEAMKFQSSCVQSANSIQGGGEEGSMNGNEDCLYLNVWSPPMTQGEIQNSQEKLPVMMWIHGGGNTVGSAHLYDPSLLVSKHKVIVVTTPVSYTHLTLPTNRCV